MIKVLRSGWQWLCEIEWPLMSRSSHYRRIGLLTARMEARSLISEKAEELKRSVDLLRKEQVDPKEFELMLHWLLDPAITTAAIRETMAEGGEQTVKRAMGKIAEAHRMRQYASALGGDAAAIERAKEIVLSERAGSAYPGRLNIVPAERLTAYERPVEEAFARQLQDVDQAVFEYTAREPVWVDPDEVRRLYSEYAEPGLHRLELTEALNSPAGALAREIWRQRLADPRTAGQGVVILAGGPASGKSTARAALDAAVREGDVLPYAAGFDSAFSAYPSAKLRIDEALASGRPVDYRYIYRSPEEAAHDAMLRGATDGRFVSEDALVKLHRGSWQTARRVMDEFGKNPSVRFEAIVDGKSLTMDEAAAWFRRPPGADIIRDQVRRGINRAVEEATDEQAKRAFEVFRRREEARPQGLQKLQRSDRGVDASGQGGEAIEAEARRLAASGIRSGSAGSPWERLVSTWKKSKTVYNPPSAIRNWYQNYVLRYLAGEDLSALPESIARLAAHPKRLLELMEQARLSGNRALDVGKGLAEKVPALRWLDEFFTRFYEGADRVAAATMSEATGKAPRRFMMDYGTAPQTIDFLARMGLVPFARWPYFAIPLTARGLIERPERLARLLRLFTASKDTEEGDTGRGEYIGLPGDQEIHARNFLPVDPGDYTGGEQSLTDPSQIPIIQLGADIATAQRADESPVKAVVEWISPPAVAHYGKELVAPSDRKPRSRAPRTPQQLIWGLLGLPVRAEDPKWDRARDARERKDELRRKARRLED